MIYKLIFSFFTQSSFAGNAISVKETLLLNTRETKRFQVDSDIPSERQMKIQS